MLFDALSACFDGPDAALEFTSRAASLTGDPAHVRLVGNSDLVFAAFRALPEAHAEPPCSTGSAR